MVIIDWLVSNPDAAALIATTVAGLFVKKKKADALAGAKDIIMTRLRREVLSLVDEYATVDKARAVLNKVVDEALEMLKVKRTDAVNLIAEPLIEVALKEFQERVGPLVLKARIEELFGAVSKLPDAFKADMAKLEASEAAFRASPNVEVIE